MTDVRGLPPNNFLRCHVPMSRATMSLACSLVGSLGFLALPALYAYGMRQETTGVSAGIAVLFVGLVLNVLCFAGITLGIVAIRKRESRTAVAWVGIIVGCLPFLAFAGWGLHTLLENLRP